MEYKYVSSTILIIGPLVLRHCVHIGNAKPIPAGLASTVVQRNQRWGARGQQARLPGVHDLANRSGDLQRVDGYGM